VSAGLELLHERAEHHDVGDVGDVHPDAQGGAV
jgi:hypothetical protein